jgi:hypothetical protein
MCYAKSFGKKVAEARELTSPRISHRELSKRLKKTGLDLSPADIAEIEKGNRPLNYYQVTILASALNTTAHHLLS